MTGTLQELTRPNMVSVAGVMTLKLQSVDNREHPLGVDEHGVGSTPLPATCCIDDRPPFPHDTIRTPLVET